MILVCVFYEVKVEVKKEVRSEGGKRPSTSGRQVKSSVCNK